MQELMKKLTDARSEKMADNLGGMFSTLPHLPKGLVEFFVKFAPIAAIIGAVGSIIATPFLGLLSVISLITLNPLLVFSMLITSALTLLTAVILLLAYKPLKNRSYTGWMLMFWCNMLSLAETLISIILSHSTVFSLIGTGIGFYILYEMRPWYAMKGKSKEVSSRKK